jgi:hypothetical protein
MEAKGATASALGRKCVVVRWADLHLESLLELVQRGAGSLLLLLPQNFTDVQGEMAEQWKELEQSILGLNIPIPVYFAVEDDTLSEIHDSLSSTALAEREASVTASLWHILTGYGYQMISEDQKEAEVVKDGHVATLVGMLPGLGVQQRLPTVTVVAHYDAYGAAPSLSTGVDSNGSGVAALLELARLFSRLYRDVKQRPRCNLLFVLSGGGKLNYFGTKHLLEEMTEELESLIQSSDYILCLDTLAALSHDTSHDPHQRPPSLAVHVSKPPKEGSAGALMLDILNQSFSLLTPQSSSLSLVHKKIRLSEDLLSWEHERFSLKRLPAATLSSVHHHKDPTRHSMFVDRSHIDVDALALNVYALADGLARYLYNLSSVEGLGGQGAGLAVFPQVHSKYLASWLDFLSGRPRSPQLVTEDHPVVAGLQQALSRSLQDVAKLIQKPDQSDPEFVLYNIPQTTLHAHRVKSPIFDLFVAVTIGLYLGLWYFLIEFFPWVGASLLPLPFKVRTKP